MKTKWIPVSLALSLSLAGSFNAHAATISQWWQQRTWNPVVALGAGSAFSSDVGGSGYFPIQNPATDQFYNYSANHPTQTAAAYDGFVGIEWNINPAWFVQAGLNYNQGSSFSALGTLTQGVDVTSADNYTYQYNILTRQLLFAAKFLYTLKEYYHPYIFAGMGAAFNDAYHYNTSVPFSLTTTRMYQSNSTTSFSYAIGFGVDATIAPYMRLGLGYRFVDFGQAKLGNAVIDTTSVSGTLSQNHLYANEVLGQLTLIWTKG